jgi:anaerobic ribonucleoside-triphosphate reductase activating protein
MNEHIMNEHLRIQTITTADVNNGTGFRVTVWVSGCTHRCPECHNAWLQNYMLGKPMPEVKKKIFDTLSNHNIDGITFSGGDPLDQSVAALQELANLLGEIHEKFPQKTIWMYTGCVYEDVVAIFIYKNILKYVDVLVDGLYDKTLRDITLPFRGSSNQRIIDVQKSLEKNKCCIIDDSTFKL